MKKDERITNREEQSPQLDWLKAELAKLDEVDLPEDFEEGLAEKLRAYEEEKKVPVFGMINEDEKVKMAKTIAYLLIPLAAAFVIIVGLSMNSLKSGLGNKSASLTLNDSADGYETTKSEITISEEASVNRHEEVSEDAAEEDYVREEAKSVEKRSSDQGGDDNAAPNARSQTDTNQQLQSQKLIYRAYLNVEIEDYVKFNGELRSKLKAEGGYVENADEQVDTVLRRGKTEELRYGSYILRVPAEKYEAFLKYIQEESKVESKNENVQNVTSEYRDTEQNVQNLELKEESLRAMMKDAKTVEESLAIFEHLSETRNLIDQSTSRLKNLDKEVSYSTIELNYSVKEKDVDIEPVDEKLGERISSKFKESINYLVGLSEDFIVAFVGNSPVYLIVLFATIIVGLILVIAVKKLLKKLDK